MSKEPSKYAIEICDMSFYYGSFRAVKHVNMNIDRTRSRPLSGLLARQEHPYCARSTAECSHTGIRMDGVIRFTTEYQRSRVFGRDPQGKSGWSSRSPTFPQDIYE